MKRVADATNEANPTARQQKQSRLSRFTPEEETSTRRALAGEGVSLGSSVPAAPEDAKPRGEDSLFLTFGPATGGIQIAHKHAARVQAVLAML